jgi:hypothetical protein
MTVPTLMRFRLAIVKSRKDNPPFLKPQSCGNSDVMSSAKCWEVRCNDATEVVPTRLPHHRRSTGMLLILLPVDRDDAFGRHSYDTSKSV